MAQPEGFTLEGEFALWLTELRVRAGNPSLMALSELTGAVPRGRSVPKSTVHKAFQGLSLPSLDDAVSIAQACVLHGHGYVHGREDVAELAAVRAECRRRWTLVKSAGNVARIRPKAPAAPQPNPAADDSTRVRSRADVAFLAKYHGCVVAMLDSMELFGVTLRRPDFRYPMSTSYISLSVERGSHGAKDLVTDGALEDVLDGSRRVEQVISGAQRVLIRGDAGSGKTTLLKWLAVGAVQKTLPEPLLSSWNGATPFFLPLRHFADRPLPTPEEFLDYTARTLAGGAPDGFVRDTLDTWPALVLIDGVDELPGSRRAEVRSWLHELTSAYPDCRYVITSRQAAVDELWLDELEFRSFELAPMSPADQNQFIAYWHATMRHAAQDADETARLDAYEQALMRSLAERRELRRLGGNPLLCALLCALHWDRDMQLPDGRLKLFEAALEMLLVRRDQQRNVVAEGPRLLSGVQQMLLRRLAYWMLRNDLTEVSFAQLTERIGAYLAETGPETGQGPGSGLGLGLGSGSGTGAGAGPEAYDAASVARQLLVRTGLLRGPAVDRVNFVHRTFQEYLAADQLLNDGDLDFLVKHAHEDQWQDVVVMVAGRARDSEGNHLVRSLLRRADVEEPHRLRLTVLAVDCVSGAVSAGVSLDRELRREVRRRAERLIPPQDTHHAEALASLGEVVLDLMPGPEAGLLPNEVQAVLHTSRVVGGASAMRVMARFAEYADLETERRLIYLWPEFDRAEFARVVLSKLPWTGPLRIGPYDLGSGALEYVDQLARLGELRVSGAAANYAMIGRMPALHSLHLLHPDPGLPGLELPPTLRTLVVGGPVRHDALLALGVREFEELSFNERGCPDCGRNAWQLMARWPAATRRGVRRLSLYGDLMAFDPALLGERFPSLDTFTVRVGAAFGAEALADCLDGLRERTGVSTLVLRVFPDGGLNRTLSGPHSGPGSPYWSRGPQPELWAGANVHVFTRTSAS